MSNNSNELRRAGAGSPTSLSQHYVHYSQTPHCPLTKLSNIFNCHHNNLICKLQSTPRAWSVCLSVCPARPAISNKNYYQSIDINSNGFIINLQFMCIVDSICEIMYSPLSHRILPVVERWSVHVPRSKPLSKCTLNGNKCYKAISPGSWVLTFTRFDPSRIQQVGWKSFKEPPHWDLTENWLRPNWDLTETWRIHDWDLRTWLRPDWDLTETWLIYDWDLTRPDWDLTET